MKHKFDPVEFLTHAAWHCKFGSASADRIPDKADLEAAAILKVLILAVRNEVPYGKTNPYENETK